MGKEGNNCTWFFSIHDRILSYLFWVRDNKTNWHDFQVSKKHVSKDVAQKIHDKAAPFIKWLKEAEEVSESSEDEIEVDFDTRAHVSRIKETSAEPAKKDSTPEFQEKSEAKSEEDDEDDVDIDNI